MLDQDVCKFYGPALALYNNYGGVVLGSALSEGEAIAATLTPETKGCILANHGLLTVGHTVDEAGYLFGLLEKSCRIQLDLKASGMTGVEIGEREARFNFEVESRPEFLYWEFQPEYDYEVMRDGGGFEDLNEEAVRLRF